MLLEIKSHSGVGRLYSETGNKTSRLKKKKTNENKNETKKLLVEAGSRS